MASTISDCVFRMIFFLSGCASFRRDARIGVNRTSRDHLYTHLSTVSINIRKIILRFSEIGGKSRISRGKQGVDFRD